MTFTLTLEKEVLGILALAVGGLLVLRLAGLLFRRKG
jgi:hypothetical protein